MIKELIMAAGIGCMSLDALAGEAYNQVYERYEFLHQYDQLILEEMTFVNHAFRHVEGYSPFTMTDARFFRAMIEVEAYYARDFDPCQIANKGDFGLSGMQADDKEGILALVDDWYFSSFREIKPTPMNKETGRWDYHLAQDRINPKLSIRGAWFWLARNKYRMNSNIEFETDFMDYTVQPGDTVSEIAKDIGIVDFDSNRAYSDAISQMVKWNPGLNPDRIRVGEKLRYKKGKLKKTVEDRGRKEMFNRYNGGGYRGHADSYFDAVKSVFKDTFSKPFISK